MKNIRILCCCMVILLSCDSNYKANKNKTSIIHKNVLNNHFVKNIGQISDKVDYYANLTNCSFFVNIEGDLVYSVYGNGGESSNFNFVEHVESEMSFAVSPQDKAETKVNYIKGKNTNKWKSNIPTYNQLNFGEIYPGIEIQIKVIAFRLSIIKL